MAGRDKTVRRTTEKGGTRRSRKGLDRERAVLQAARRVLVESGYEQFSLRNVAAAAGMHLSNLQYYFPTRDALILRLMSFVQEEYEARYEERFASLASDLVPRFAAMVDYLVQDIHSADTRRFFIQFWALLECTAPAARLLNQTYSPHIATLARYVKQINPGLSRHESQQRATMIAAMIEGMMLMLDDADLHRAKGDRSISAVMREQIIRIATDPG